MKFYQNLIKLLALFATIIFVYETFIMNCILENNLIMTIYSNAVISFIAFMHLFKIIKDEIKIHNFILQKNFDIALSIFYSASFFISLFETKIKEQNDYFFYIIFSIYSILIIIENLIFSKIIWKLKQN
jgi:hypothetical protein